MRNVNISEVQKSCHNWVFLSTLSMLCIASHVVSFAFVVIVAIAVVRHIAVVDVVHVVTCSVL